MEIERLAVSVRPRSAWEAVDLGVRMTRIWWRPIMLAWLSVVVPVALLIHLIIPTHPWFALLLLWWLKPLFDRIPLLVISRSVFGDVPDLATTLRALPQALRNGWLFALTFHRATRARSFTLAAIQLEGLRGAALSARQRVLRHRSLGVAAMLQLTCLFFELAVLICLYLMVLILVPPFEVSAAWEGIRDDTHFGYNWLHNALSLAAVAMVEPFYVGAGFSLYINRRVELEGWDLELIFRKIARRFEANRDRTGGGGSLAAMLLLGLLVGGSATATRAEHLPASESKATITDVLEDSEFDTTERETRWLPRFDGDFKCDGSDNSEESGFPGLGLILASGMRWLLLIALVCGIALLLTKIRVGRGRRRSDPEEVLPEVVAGLDIRPESLPDDVIEAARARWRDGDPRAALSLLYRGALAHLVRSRSLTLSESDTEGECLKRVRSTQQGGIVDAFASLTGAWQRIAYAHDAPSQERFDDLCGAWSPLLRDPRSENASSAGDPS